MGADLFHDVIDKVWPDDGIIPWSSASEYRRIVEFLDAIPPQAQSELGRWFLRKRRELARGERKPSGVVRINRQDRFVYGCSDRKYWDRAESWQAHFHALTALRHAQALESGAAPDSVTLGVGAGRAYNGSAWGFIFFRLAGRSQRNFTSTFGSACLPGIAVWNSPSPVTQEHTSTARTQFTVPVHEREEVQALLRKIGCSAG